MFSRLPSGGSRRRSRLKENALQIKARWLLPPLTRSPSFSEGGLTNSCAMFVTICNNKHYNACCFDVFVDFILLKWLPFCHVERNGVQSKHPRERTPCSRSIDIARSIVASRSPVLHTNPLSLPPRGRWTASAVEGANVAMNMYYSTSLILPLAAFNMSC